MSFTSGRLPLDIVPMVGSNHLYYGDNLTIMKSIPASSVDLIYLDPPFNSQRNYNLIYTKLTGQPVPEQEEAFCDAWELDPEKEDMLKRMPIVFEEYGADPELVQFWRAWIGALRGTQPRLLAYLVYMTYRLFEMHRILSSRGSIYLHCDPHASHYVKVIMDGIFGHDNFRNEIVWKRTTIHKDAKRFGRVHDILLFYSKGENFTWNPLFSEHHEAYVKSHYTKRDPDGRRYRLDNATAAGHGPARLFFGKIMEPPSGTHWRWSQENIDKLTAAGRIVATGTGRPAYKRYLDEMKGHPVGDSWDDIPPVNSQAKERLGYPTQKPIALLQRIIAASTNPGDVVFDPFCGCGTSIYAAHLLNRKWIGCDIAILSVRLVQDVLLKRYALEEDKHYTVAGVPKSVDAAHVLFEKDPRQFQHWAVELARGFASAKYSGDRGIDGRIHFETKDGLKNMVISVKGGKLAPTYVRDLSGVVQREADTALGGLICLESPTRGMFQEVADGGTYDYDGQAYHRLQIRTIDDLLHGKWFDTPATVRTMGKSSQTVMPV